MTAALPKTQVQFLNHRSEKLVGTLLDPEHTADDPLTAAAAAGSAAAEAGSAAAPVVILAHGYMSSQNSELLVRLATALARNCQLASLRCVQAPTAAAWQSTAGNQQCPLQPHCSPPDRFSP